MYFRHDWAPFDERVKTAENAVNQLKGYQKQWFRRLLDLLINKHCVRIWKKNNAPLDVQAIADTGDYLSFFDVYNHIHYMKINYSRFPEPIPGLEFPIKEGFDYIIDWPF